SLWPSAPLRELHSFPTRRSSDLECFQCDDPGRDGGGEVLRQEGPQRLVFPGLDVACRPVVQDAQAKHALFSEIDRNARAQGIARDRKSTRLNSSHVKISYAVFCL